MKLSMIVAAAALALSGCGAPILIGAPGQLRQAEAISPVESIPENPALCAASINGVSTYYFLAGLSHSFVLLTNEHPDLAGCDLILKVFQSGASIFHRAEVTAFSAYSGEMVWQGSGSGTAGILGSTILVSHLVREFNYGMPLRRKLDEEAAAGRRITPADLSRAGLVLLSESAMSKKDVERLATLRQLMAGRTVRSLAGPSSAPRVPSIAPAPVPAAPPRRGSDLDELPAARPASARRHAVVIGIERYRETLPKADFAADDARLAAEYFKRALGVPPENVALLVDDRATNVDFQKYFERWLPNRVHEGDEVFVYFSGHGSPNPAKGDAYLVPFDGDPTYIEQTGYSVKRMYEHLAKLPAQSVTVAMDSCFSGAGGRSVLARGARPLISLQTAEIPARLTVLSASAGDQISNSYQEKGHGLFTYYLLKGLKEKGGDFRAAYGYLKPEVARVAREQYNADQDPQWREGK